MSDETTKQIEFGKLAIGSKFYLTKPVESTSAVFTKITSSKNDAGVWSNAKNGFGLTTFVQYDKRVWTKS
jgi:hypothetical protein